MAHKALQTVYKLLHAIYCFFFMYIFLLLFSIPTLVLIVYRGVLSLIFKICYRGRYGLVYCRDAAFTMDTYANVMTITFFAQIKGPCDIDKLRERLASNLLRKNNNGRRPYGLLLKAVVQRFGFSCWEDKSESIDFTDHVRLCPGADDENRIYSENELFDAVAKLTNDLWDEDKPRWEFLVTPKVTLNETEVCSIVTLRMHHVYVDGIALVQVLRNLVCDEPPPKLAFDPVNPPLPPVPFYKWILLYMQILFLGPYFSMRLMGQKSDRIFYDEDPLTTQKILGRTKMEIPIGIIRAIRKRYNTSTQAILHSAFTSALQNMAVRKGYTVPNQVIGGILYAKFPYPDEYPRNAVLFGYEPIPIGFSNPKLRLEAMDQAVRTLNGRQFALLASQMLLKIMGVYPSCILESMMDSLHATYFISNVPGIDSVGKLHGHLVENMFGVPPLVNGIRYTVGVGYYNGKFTVGFLFEKSRVVTCRNDMEEFIQEFENEVTYFANHT